MRGGGNPKTWNPETGNWNRNPEPGTRNPESGTGNRNPFYSASYFSQAKAMQRIIRVFEELVLFDLWIPVSGSRLPNS